MMIPFINVIEYLEKILISTATQINNLMVMLGVPAYIMSQYNSSKPTFRNFISLYLTDNHTKFRFRPSKQQTSERSERSERRFGYVNRLSNIKYASNPLETVPFGHL
jgi:hypothetical protein